MEEDDPETVSRRVAKKRKLSTKVDEYNQISGSRMSLIELFEEHVPKYYILRLKYFCRKLPYVIRIYIIDYISFLNSRFLVKTKKEVTEKRTVVRNGLWRGYNGSPTKSLVEEERKLEELEEMMGEEEGEEEGEGGRRRRKREVLVGDEVVTQGKGRNYEVMYKVRDFLGREFKVVKSVRFLPQVFSYKLGRNVGFSKFISLMYGYFKTDFTRKPFLIYGYLVYRLNDNLIRIPQVQTRQLYFLNGRMNNKNDFESIPCNLRNFCLAEIEIKVKDLICILKKLKKLRKFAVKQIKGLNNPEVLKLLRKVKIIRAMECDLVSKSVDTLFKDNSKTRSLNLCENGGVTSAAFTNFSKNNSINMMCLDDTGIDNSAMHFFSGHKCLHELQVNNTQVSHLGVFKCLAHPTLRNLEIGFLDLSNFCYPVKKKLTEKMIYNFKTVEKVFVDYSKFGPAFLQFLRDYCTNLSNLSAFNCHLTDDKLSIILSFEKIRSLCVSYNAELTCAAVFMLCKSSKIKRLEYCQHQLGDEEAIFLLQSSSIQDLWVDGPSMSNKCLVGIEKNMTLKYLNVAGENQIDKFGIIFVINSCKSILELKHKGFTPPFKDVVFYRD